MLKEPCAGPPAFTAGSGPAPLDPTTEKFYDGAGATVALQVGSADDALTVPTSAGQRVVLATVSAPVPTTSINQRLVNRIGGAGGGLTGAGRVGGRAGG